MNKYIITLACLLSVLLSSCGSSKKEDVKNSQEEEIPVANKNEGVCVQLLTWNDAKFEISIADDTLSIQPIGLEEVNDKFVHIIEGKTVTGIEIADINNDKHADIFIYLTSDGSGSYGDLIVYSVNNGKSMSEVSYNVEGDSDEIKDGYMGHDKFALVGDLLVRSFPIYKENDTNANPTGGTRVIEYKLVNGANSRKLEVASVTTK